METAMRISPPTGLLPFLTLTIIYWVAPAGRARRRKYGPGASGEFDDEYDREERPWDRGAR